MSNQLNQGRPGPSIDYRHHGTHELVGESFERRQPSVTAFRP